MSAPLKPWERPGMNYQSSPWPSTSNETTNSMAAGPLGADSVRLAGGGDCCPTGNVSSAPPSLPPRPEQQQNSFNNRLGMGSGYGLGGGMYNSPYSSYGGNSYGGYGSYGGMYNSPYSSYGGYGYNNRMGDVQSEFARHAEQSSRPAFESIESIVSAVNSVGMMLDSTFQAVYNSFRAVIGVADNFTRLKSQLIQVFSALAFIRTLKYMCRRLLEILRLKPQGEANRLWLEAFSEASSSFPAAGPGGGPKKSSWPILMFFGIIMGGPYLIWKIISSFASPSPDEAAWANGEADHFVARANYSFQAGRKEEVSFSQGQNINVAPKELQPQVRGWLLASVDGKTTGLIPANYVKVLGKRRGTKNHSQAVTNSSPELPPQQSDSSSTFSQEFEGASLKNPRLSEPQMNTVFNSPSSESLVSNQNNLDTQATNPNNKDVTNASNQDVTNLSDQDASDILNEIR